MKLNDVFALSKDHNTIDAMNRANILAGLIMTPLIALFEVIMIALTSKNIAEGGSPVRFIYLQCYVVLLVATLIGFTLLLVWRRHAGRHRRKLISLAHIYSAVILLWAVAITFLDVARGGQLTVYLTVLVVLACAFYLQPRAACLIFGGSAALLIALSYIYASHSLDIVINLLVFAVFMAIVAVVRYGSKKESMFQESVIVEQNKELNQLNEKLRVLSSTDMLTGLYNRRFYDESGTLLAEQCMQEGQEMAAILLDIDEFKKINDTYGHKTGDVCIRTVACIIADCARCYGGTAYRFGGEEFLAIVPDCGIDRAGELAESIRRAVEQTPVEGVEYAVTVSAGCYAKKPETGGEAEAFVNRADHAMYRAKANGRNAVVLDR